MLEIVICEDNDQYRELLTKFLTEIINRREIAASIVLTCSSFLQAEALLMQKSPNVFFLDIDLDSPKNGIDLANMIHEKIPYSYVVFVSQYTNMVFKSFKVRPFDFLPKPVSKKDLEAVLLEIDEDYQKRKTSQQPDFISIKLGGKIHQIAKDKIILLEKFGNKCTIHATDKTIYCYQSLDTISKRLASNDFIRCHKSFIVNRNHIEQVNLKDMEIILTGNHKCFIGGKYKKDLISQIGLSSDR